MARARSRLIAPVLVGLIGTGILLALCIWQVQRLDWKEGLIARLEARLSAEAVAIPDSPDPQRDDFLRVSAEGRLGQGTAWVLTTLRPYGPGYRTVVPVTLDDGRRVLADLGFVREEDRGEVLPEPGTPLSFTGALFWPEGGDSFTPDPEPSENLFFSRRVGPLAEHLGTEPILVVAESHSLGERPIAQRLGVDLPNNHLNYAITWFLLAVVWAVMSAVWARREVRAA